MNTTSIFAQLFSAFLSLLMPHTKFWEWQPYSNPVNYESLCVQRTGFTLELTMAYFGV